MELSFSTLGCPDWDFQTIARNAHEYGFQGVEIRGITNLLDHTKIPYFSTSAAEKTKRFLERYQLQLVSLDTSIALHDDMQWETNLQQAKQEIAICSRMNIPAIRVFGDKVDNQNINQVLSRIITRLHILCAIDPTVAIRLEIHGDFRTIELLEPIIKEMKEPNFGIIWDVEHSHAIYGSQWKEFYSCIQSKIQQVHIKDTSQGKLCLTGEGDIPLKDIIQTLLTDGYNGFFSFEWEKRWHPGLLEPEIAMPQYIQFMTGFTKNFLL